MQLIGMLDSPYVRRVAIAFIVAGVPFEHRPISLFRHIDEFVKFSPLLKAPSLVVDDGTVLVDSHLIVDHVATFSPALSALRPATLPATRATGLAMTVSEKAVQFHYERALREPGERNARWVARVTRQLDLALEALDRELPTSRWIDGAALGLADISVGCAFGFTQGTIPDALDLARYPNLAAFAARAEALPAFRAAPPVDGVTAPFG